MMTLIRRVGLQTKYLFETPPTAQEIHDDFETATQGVVESAKAILKTLDIDTLAERVQTLKDLGFTSMPEVVEFQQKKIAHGKLKTFIDTAEKYAQKYPQYKFITVDTAITICKKYGLVCAPVKKYKGGIPDKNLKEIANFKVSEEDTYYERSSRSDRNDTDVTNPNSFANGPDRRAYYDCSSTPVTKFICAPYNHFVFNKDDKPFGEVFITRFIKDPIVLHFVRDGFLIVSKWGPEASEPALINEKMN